MKNIKVVGSFLDLPSNIPSNETCDLIEVRLDHPIEDAPLRTFLADCPQEILLTARDIQEGGETELTADQRIAKLQQYLPLADYIDVEMRNWDEMSPLISEAQSLGKKVICSYHDFEKTPSYDELSSLFENALNLKADVIKFAFMTKSLEDIAICQKLLLDNKNREISIMGMGKYAPISRVLLAQSGSVLNYGYLGDTITAPGQWSAELLKKAISNSDSLV